MYTLINGIRHIYELGRVEARSWGKKRYYMIIAALPVVTAANAYASLIYLRIYLVLTFVTDMLQARRSWVGVASYSTSELCHPARRRPSSAR